VPQDLLRGDAGGMTKSLLPAGCIVVGVDGSEHAERAIIWAAAQAARERRTLALVHSSDELVLREPAWLEMQGIDHRELTRALTSAARATLVKARDRAMLAAPGIRVLTELVETDPREALVDLSEDAHLLVVGSRGRGPLRTALMGSVSASVARRAACPVVVCRPPEFAPSVTNRVVVGADGTHAAQPVLEFAFAQASLRGLPLTVMHCFWDVISATRGSGVVPAREDGDLADLRLLMAESAAGLAEKYPDVTVTQELAQGLVDECLADHTPDAELLVVGRASAVGWPRFLHTSCALAVLERARTTVAVVPETEER
jgi:nucleotide-binding universal stress UspA family protein